MLDSYLDNLSAAATKEQSVLNRLVSISKRLATNNNTTLADIKTTLTNGANTNTNGWSTSGSVAAAGRGSTSPEVAALKRQV